MRKLGVMAGGQDFFTQNGLPVPPIRGEVNQETETVSFILINDQLAGIITMTDSIRKNAEQAIRSLKEMNIKSFLLTGDNEKIAASVPEKLEMDGYLSNVLSHQK